MLEFSCKPPGKMFRIHIRRHRKNLCLANSQFWRKRAERNRIAVNRPKSAAGAVTNIRWKCSIRSKLPEFKVVQKRVCTKVTPRLAFDIAHGSAAAIDTN